MSHTYTALVRRQRMIELLAQGMNTTEVAVETGVSIRTVQRALADPAVMASLRALQSERLRLLLHASIAVAPAALESLRRTAESPLAPSAARVQAARALLSAMLSMVQSVDLTERIAELEGRIDALAHPETGLTGPDWGAGSARPAISDEEDTDELP
jgi:hypothetical protein